MPVTDQWIYRLSYVGLGIIVSLVTAGALGIIGSAHYSCVYDLTAFWTAATCIVLTASGVIAFVAYKASERQAVENRSLQMLKEFEDRGLDRSVDALTTVLGFERSAAKNADILIVGYEERRSNGSVRLEGAASDLYEAIRDLSNHFGNVARLIENDLVNAPLYLRNMKYTICKSWALSDAAINVIRDNTHSGLRGIESLAEHAYPWFVRIGPEGRTGASYDWLCKTLASRFGTSIQSNSRYAEDETSNR